VVALVLDWARLVLAGMDYGMGCTDAG